MKPKELIEFEIDVICKDGKPAKMNAIDVDLYKEFKALISDKIDWSL